MTTTHDRAGTLNVGMIGYGFMGAAHSHAWRNAHRFFDLPATPVLQVVVGRDADRYGRKLRIVAVDGASVGETLVAEGLARWYGSGRRSWC